MPEGIDQALAKSGKSWPIYLNSKPAMGTSTHTINTLFKRKSLFKPKSQECSSPACQSSFVAPHQEPFAPMFENHTSSSRTVASSWLLPGLGGREPGSLVSGERARIAPQRHGIISRQCQRDRTKPWRNPDNPGRSISTQNLPWAPPPILYIPYLSENRFLSLSPKKPHPQNVSPGLLHPTRSHLCTHLSKSHRFVTNRCEFVASGPCQIGFPALHEVGIQRTDMSSRIFLPAIITWT